MQLTESKRFSYVLDDIDKENASSPHHYAIPNQLVPSPGVIHTMHDWKVFFQSLHA